MKVAGIIAEYNPFHAGHHYHIEETRRMTGADYVIAVISGDYVQRGEPAIADKYMRTQMALSGGVDLVLEMPVVYATASAEYFATAGVKLLDGLGCVDILSFGSEWGQQEDFASLASLFLEEPPEYKTYLQQGLRSGKNFGAARAFAAGMFLTRFEEGDQKKKKQEMVESFLKEPNHILGLEYIKALICQNSPIKPLVIQRKGSRYHEEDLGGEYACATAIRNLLHQNQKKFTENVKRVQETLKVAAPYLSGGKEPFLHGFFHGNYAEWEDLMPYLDYTVLMKKKVLGKYFGMNLELTRRMQKLFDPGLTFPQLIQKLHSRQMADASLQRALLHIVLQVKDSPFLDDARQIPVPYARVLGFSKTAAPLLKEIRSRTKLHLIQKVSEGKKYCKEGSDEAVIFDLDIRSADLYEQIAARKTKREPVSEFRRHQVIQT